MARCTTCGLFQVEESDEFKAKYGEHGEHLPASLVYGDVIDLSGQIPIFLTALCVVQEEAFLQQSNTPQIEVHLIEPHQIFDQEHSCPYYNAKIPGVPLGSYIKQYTKERRALRMRHIMLTGNTIIGSQIGVVGSSMETYIQQLNVGASATNEERELKETLIKLRNAIETSPDLPTFEKKAAMADVDILTSELSKPADQQEEATVKGFWYRLKDTVSISSGLTTIAMALGKILGLVA